jgi:hypothetical protein
MGFDFAINYEGIVFDPKAMWFLPLESANRPSELGLRIGITGLTDHIQRAAANAALIILDTALGERAAASDVQHVEIEVLPSDPARAGYIELHQLAEFIAWRKRRVVPA